MVSDKPTKHSGGNGHDEVFEPEITVFTCNYCGYMSADTAGAQRLQYPPTIKLVRLPCTGKTDVAHLLKAFEDGADGVYVVGCSLGNCHHVRGNERGLARVQRTKQLLDEIRVGQVPVLVSHLLEDEIALLLEFLNLFNHPAWMFFNAFTAAFNN